MQRDQGLIAHILKGFVGRSFVLYDISGTSKRNQKNITIFLFYSLKFPIKIPTTDNLTSKTIKSLLQNTWKGNLPQNVSKAQRMHQ